MEGISESHQRIAQLEEAQELIECAINLIEEAVKNTSQEKACHYYIIGHLNGWSSGENDDTSIPNLIEKLRDK
jgi:hypothetical protein